MNWFVKAQFQPYKFFMQCDLFRRSREDGNMLWQRMMDNAQKISLQEFLQQVDPSGMLDADEQDRPQEVIAEMERSDPSTFFAKSTLGDTPVYFLGTSGFEFIFTPNGQGI